MLEAARRLIMRTMRVPAEPEPPAGEDLLVFRAAPAFYRYKLIVWALAQLSTLIGLLFGLFFLTRYVPAIGIGFVEVVFRFVEASAVLAFLVQLPLSYALVRLDIDMRWYMLTDRALRIREGIVRVQEKTMTFANVQQISIRQNPIQRIFGIADVYVRTAGGGETKKDGEGGEAMHEGFFHGVDNAAQIRDLIRDRVRLYRDAGLGDADDAPALPDREPDLIGAIAALREETEALRAFR